MNENLFSSFLTSALLTFFLIPPLIKVAKVKKLFDEPNSRTSHSSAVPTLGGIAIYISIIFTVSFWADFGHPSIMKYVFAATTVVTFMGLKDDLLELSAYNKLMGQMFAAMIFAIWGDIRLTSFYGIFGIQELPYIISVIFTVFTILVIVNAFNLIDGINGLAAGITIVASLTFGVCFFILDPSSEIAFLAFALIGALISFLRYNLAPSKIFMGDTGSLLLGILVSVMAIRFIELDAQSLEKLHISSTPALAMGVISYPLFDLLRVFSIRISQGKSPFQPDRNHIHHLLLDNGLSHETSSLIIALVNILVITLVFCFSNLGNYWLGVIILGIYFTFTMILKYLKNKRR